MKIKDIIYEGLIGDVAKNIGARMRYMAGAQPEKTAHSVATSAETDYNKFLNAPGEDSQKYRDWLKTRTAQNMTAKRVSQDELDKIRNQPIDIQKMGRALVSKKVLAKPTSPGHVPFGTEVPTSTGFATKGADGHWYDDQGQKVEDPAVAQRHEQYAQRRQDLQRQTAQTSVIPVSTQTQPVQQRGGRRR